MGEDLGQGMQKKKAAWVVQHIAYVCGFWPSFEFSLHYNSLCSLHCTMRTVMTSLCVYELDVVSEMH